MAPVFSPINRADQENKQARHNDLWSPFKFIDSRMPMRAVERSADLCLDPGSVTH